MVVDVFKIFLEDFFCRSLLRLSNIRKAIAQQLNVHPHAINEKAMVYIMSLKAHLSASWRQINEENTTARWPDWAPSSVVAVSANANIWSVYRLRHH